MVMNNPFFSVVIPTFNRAKVLPRAINSVLSQSFKDFELIIVDDGSTDSTKELVETLYEGRLKCIQQANAGVSAARNFGVQFANGKYIIFLDSDDVLMLDALKMFADQVVFYNPDLVFASAKIKFDYGGEFIKQFNSSRIGNYSDNEGMQLPGAFCLRSSKFKEVGGYDPKISYGENTELFWRIFMSKVLVRVISEVTVTMTRQTINRISIAPNKIISSNTYVLNKHSSYLNLKPYVKWLYLNSTAIAYAKIKKKAEAMELLVLAVKIKPFLLKAYLRLLLVVFGIWYKAE